MLDSPSPPSPSSPGAPPPSPAEPALLVAYRVTIASALGATAVLVCHAPWWVLIGVAIAIALPARADSIVTTLLGRVKP